MHCKKWIAPMQQRNSFAVIVAFVVVVFNVNDVVVVGCHEGDDKSCYLEAEYFRGVKNECLWGSGSQKRAMVNRDFISLNYWLHATMSNSIEVWDFKFLFRVANRVLQLFHILCHGNQKHQIICWHFFEHQTSSCWKLWRQKPLLWQLNSSLRYCKLKHWQKLAKSQKNSLTDWETSS